MSCSTNSLKTIKTNIASTEKNLESFTKNSRFNIELDKDERIHATVYKSKDGMQKIYIQYESFPQETIIYFKRSEPILIIEDIKLPTEYSFPFPINKNEQPVIKLNNSSKNKIFIQKWKGDPRIKIIQISGKKFSENEFSKQYYQNLIDRIKAVME